MAPLGYNLTSDMLCAGVLFILIFIGILILLIILVILIFIGILILLIILIPNLHWHHS